VKGSKACLLARAVRGDSVPPARKSGPQGRQGGVDRRKAINPYKGLQGAP